MRRSPLKNLRQRPKGGWAVAERNYENGRALFSNQQGGPHKQETRLVRQATNSYQKPELHGQQIQPPLQVSVSVTGSTTHSR